MTTLRANSSMLVGFQIPVGLGAQAIGTQAAARTPAFSAQAVQAAPEVAAPAASAARATALPANFNPQFVGQQLYKVQTASEDKRPATATLSRGTEQLSLARNDEARAYALARIFGEAQKGLAAASSNLYVSAQNIQTMRGSLLAESKVPAGDVKSELPVAASAQSAQEAKPYYTSLGMLIGGLLPPLSAIVAALTIPHLALGIPAAVAGAAAGWFLLHARKLAFLNDPSNALIKSTLLILSVSLLWYSFSLAPVFSIPLAAISGLGATLGSAPLVGKLKKVYTTIQESLVWFRGYWKRVKQAGITVRKDFLIASLLALITTGLSFIPPSLYGQMVKHLKDLTPFATTPSALPWYQALFTVPVLITFLKLGALLLGVYLIEAAVLYMYSRRMFTIGNKMMEGLSNLFGRQVINLPMSWHGTRAVGEVLSTATEAIYNVQRTATDAIVDTLRYGTLTLGALAGMLIISPQMTLGIAPFLVIALAIPASLYSNATKQAYKLFFSVLKPKFASQVEQNMLNIEPIKAGGQHNREIGALEQKSHATYIDGGEAIARVSAPSMTLSNAITNATRVVVILTAILFVFFGHLSIEAATAYFFISGYFRDGVQKLSDTYLKLAQMQGSSKKFDKIMDQSQEDYNVNGIVLPETTRGRAIKFENVSFGYKPGQKVIEGVTLDVKPGEMVAFVGESGSGKTTLTRLALGLYPFQGRVLVDGVDLKDLNREAFRQRVGSVLQESIPFNTSISYNIGYLRPGASEAEIWRAAEEAGLHKDIVRLGYDRNLQDPKEDEAALEKELLAKIKAGILQARQLSAGAAPVSQEIFPDKSILDNIRDQAKASFDQIADAARQAGIHDDIIRFGYAARVGERGVNLSGGQKQRLLIARLFVDSGKPWDVMVLDEPTANLDGMTQRLIQDAVEKRRGKSTVFMIAHRLSTIQDADKIVVFNRGRIVEEGHHEDLMRAGGVYAKLWEAQKLIAEATGDAPVAREKSDNPQVIFQFRYKDSKSAIVAQRADDNTITLTILDRNGAIVRILETGSHEELMGRDGIYAKLWEAQKLLAEADAHAQAITQAIRAKNKVDTATLLSLLEALGHNKKP